jgi:hypothetical protein
MANELTQDKGMIIFPVRLLEKIDRSRDRLSRAEFVEFCVDTLLKQEEVSVTEPEEKISAKGAKAEESVSRQEFEEFKNGIKNLQRAYIELLLAVTLEPLSKASAEEVERFKERLAELLEGEDGKQD